MSKIVSYSIGQPTEEKPGLWYVVVSVDKNHRLYFDVEGYTVQSFYENPELREIFAGGNGVLRFVDVVSEAYRILQDHVAQPGAPAYSFAYRLATRTLAQRLADSASKD